MTFDDYEQVKEYLDTRNIKTDNEIVDTNVGGIFYVIQLEPEHDPGRYKLGSQQILKKEFVHTKLRHHFQNY